MIKMAIVFGYSDQGINLAKQLLLTFFQHARFNTEEYEIDPYAYACNFRITDEKAFKERMLHPEQQDLTCIRFDSCSRKIEDDFKEFLFWPGNIHILNASGSDFRSALLPDVAIYHDFATKYAQDYEYVLYCHNDLVFQPSKLRIPDRWINIVADNTKYSIITEMRAICNKELSLRFHCCFIFVNQKKFHESRLSFINDHQLIDPHEFHVYANGGSALLASFYAKSNETTWQPYLLDTHGTYRDIDIDRTQNDCWFNHLAAIEWNREEARSEGGNPQRTQEAYDQAEKYVKTLL